MRLSPSIYLVGGTGVGLTDGHDCHIYLVKGPTGIFLIDAGNGYDTESLMNNIKSEGFNPQDISHILITHHHTYHARGAKALKDSIGCEVWISEKTGRHLLENGTDEELGIPYAKEHGMYAEDYVYIHCPIDRGINDGEEFTIAGVNIKTINVIGHSYDSLCYLMQLDGRRCLFNGDTVYSGGVLGVINYQGSNLSDYHIGLPRLKGLDIDALLPGHGLFCLKNGQDAIDAGLKQLDSIFVPSCVGQNIRNV